MPGPATKEIDGNTWTLGLLGSSEGLDMAVRVAKLLGQGVADAIAAQGNSARGTAALLLGLSRAEPKEVQSLVKTLLKTALMDGKPLFGPEGKGGVYESAFVGRILVMFKVAAWAIQANAGDFSAVFESPAASQADSETEALDGDNTSERTGFSSAPS